LVLFGERDGHSRSLRSEHGHERVIPGRVSRGGGVGQPGPAARRVPGGLRLAGFGGRPLTC
jgi:hypothetical protein